MGRTPRAWGDARVAHARILCSSSRELRVRDASGAGRSHRCSRGGSLVCDRTCALERRGTARQKDVSKDTRGSRFTYSCYSHCAGRPKISAACFELDTRCSRKVARHREKAPVAREGSSPAARDCHGDGLARCASWLVGSRATCRRNASPRWLVEGRLSCAGFATTSR